MVPAGFTDAEALVNYALEGAARARPPREGGVYRSTAARNSMLSRTEDSVNTSLTMKAIADKANEVQLTGPGRGSAAGSLAAYVLGITQIDPIKYGLLFERFLRKDATDYPDIDYDVAEPMELKEMLMEDWGKNSVIPISNWNTLQLKSLIKDISKFYGVEFGEVNKVTSTMIAEATPAAKMKHGLRQEFTLPHGKRLWNCLPPCAGT